MNNPNCSHIRKPLYLAVSTAIGVLLAFPSWAQSPEYDDEELLIEEVIVTGSRIKRSTNTLSQEIIVFTAEDIQASGDISVAEALRSSTLNSFGSIQESSGSTWQSNATLDLRGVGAERNLVILNGRRTVGSPSLWGGGTVNLNMFPFAAVDRIEIIADGASAVYGSDAIVGVTNIILKKNYQGLTVQARYGDRSEDDGTEESASFLIGASGERGSITFSLEYDKRDPIYDADREYTRAKWADYDGDGVILGYEETEGVSYFGYTLENPDWYWGLEYDPENPETWPYTPGAGCTEGDGWAGIIDFGYEDGFYCGYAYALVSTNRAGLERLNSFVSAEYELTDSINLFADVLMAQNESFGRYAPPAAQGPPIPGDPRNDIGATWGFFRFVEIGTRDSNVTDNLTDINIGARGEIGGSVSWEAYYTYSNYVSSNMGNYYLSWAGLSYNIGNDIDDFDQFVSNMKTTTLNDDRQKLQKVFAGLQFDLFQLPGGTVSAYAGAEHFKIDYQALVDAQSEAGLVGGSAGNSAWGYREVTALFAEAVFPIFNWWEVDMALRNDDYSDFGSSTVPRIGTVIQIPAYDALRFKASWGEGFKAPELSALFGVASNGYAFVTDYYGCQLNGYSEEDCRWTEVEAVWNANPELDAEKSETFSIGADWQFTDRWLASVNYFHLELEQAHVYPSITDELDLDYFSGGNNPAVHRDQWGWAEYVDARPKNSSVPLSFDSIDFALSGGLGFDFGDFGLQANASHYLNYERELTYGTGDTYNAAGDLYWPDWRANILLSWNLHDAFASVNWDYTSAQEDRITGETADVWYTFNVQAGYGFGRFGTFTLGANNVLNRGPETDENGFVIDKYQFIHDFTGRVIYLSYRVEL